MKFCSCTPVPSGLCSSTSAIGYYSPYQPYNESTAVELLQEIQMFIGDEAICRDIDLLTDAVCSFIYPPCLPESGLPLGLCKDTCTSLSDFVNKCIPIHQLLSENESSLFATMFATAFANLNCSDTPVPLVRFEVPGVGIEPNVCLSNFEGTYS